MYSVGENVLYGVNGVCCISEITTKAIGDSEQEYYVLKPYFSKTAMFYVPTQSEVLVAKMRSLLSKEEINDILDNLPEIEEWISNKGQRFEMFKGILASGDINAVVNMIRLIRKHEGYQMARGRRLHITDERFLREAKKMVCEEFAFVLEISQAEAYNLLAV